MATTTTIALDLEGTLISNAVSQFPRPGLLAFLHTCFARFDRVVIYTAVSSHRAREILATLEREGHAPEGFAQLEVVEWEGDHKDLCAISELASLEHCWLVDDNESYVAPGQHARWLQIPCWESPYHDRDRELAALAARFDTILSQP